MNPDEYPLRSVEEMSPGQSPVQPLNAAERSTEAPETTAWSTEPYPVEYMVPVIEWEPIPGLPDRFNTLKRQEWAALIRISELSVSPASVVANAAELTDLAEQIRILGFKADRVLSQHFVSRGIQ